jgi:hypothetical protein
MNREQFIFLLDNLCFDLTKESQLNKINKWLSFEERVKEYILKQAEVKENNDPYRFPDIVSGEFGVEVKFTKGDKWSSFGNSILESKRDKDVKEIFVVFGKMGGTPEVKWKKYEDCIVKVCVTHSPRFIVDLELKEKFFERIGIEYDCFRNLSMKEKMKYVKTDMKEFLKMTSEDFWWE